jgi:hypothetical protein
MATKKKGSNGRGVSTAKKATVASKKRRATKGPVLAKKAGASKKVAPSNKPRPPKKALAPKTTPMRRRDGTGHLDAGYAAMLREKSLEGRVQDPDGAFIGRSGRSRDHLAEAMGETWIETATSGEDENEDVFNQSVPEDEGGPFVTTTAGQEFAEGTDASNPKGSKREAFPKT